MQTRLSMETWQLGNTQLKDAYIVDHILRESSIAQYHYEYCENYIQAKLIYTWSDTRYDIPEGAFFPPDYSPVYYGAIDLASLVLSPFDLDFLADGAGLFYAYYRGDVAEITANSAEVAVPFVQPHC